jgi:endogenous inhibitor of DNA gyrase (YacG/DUF329 family)
MPRKKVASLRCPTCRTIVMRSDEYFPFCSDRCRLIDLGKWASGAYKITSPVLDPELVEDAEANRSRIEERHREDDSDPTADRRKQ